MHNSYFKYTPLTTADDAQAFQSDLSRQYEMMRNMAQTLPGKHKTVWRSGMGMGGGYNQNVYPPDQDAFYVGFSMILSMLNRVVQTIKETDDTLQALIDDSDDEEDILHASGELFAAKTIYINLVAGIEPLENSRAKASQEGMGSKEYFNLVQKVGDIPNVVPYASSGMIGTLNAGRLNMGSITSASISNVNPAITRNLAFSPSVSAVPPKIPNLLP